MTKSRLRSALHYRLYDSGRGLLSCFGIVTVVFLVFALLGMTVFNEKAGQFGGLEFAITIMLFVVGIVCIREDMRMFCQFGVTRRSTFLAELLGAALTCLAASLGVLLFGWLGELLFGILGMSDATISLYQLEFNVPGSVFALPFGQLLLVLCYNFSNYLAVICLGMFISLLYYRMSKFLTVVVSVAGGLLLFFGLPMLAPQLAAQPFVQAVLRLFVWIAGAPGHHILITLILAVLFSGLSYLLFRRAPIK